MAFPPTDLATAGTIYNISSMIWCGPELNPTSPHQQANPNYFNSAPVIPVGCIHSSETIPIIN